MPSSVEKLIKRYSRDKVLIVTENILAAEHLYFYGMKFYSATRMIQMGDQVQLHNMKWTIYLTIPIITNHTLGMPTPVY